MAKATTNKVKLASRKVMISFYSHRCSAKKRGIPFLMTFEQWLNIWQASGKLEDRGKCFGQYHMARFGDKGPYHPNNVRIVTCTENHREARVGKPLSLRTKRKLSRIFKGRILSDETKARMSRFARGKILSDEHRLNIGRTLNGAGNPQAKLTWNKVRRIRELRKQGVATKDLSKRFGVCQQVIRNVINGDSYDQNRYQQV